MCGKFQLIQGMHFRPDAFAFYSDYSKCAKIHSLRRRKVKKLKRNL